MRILVCMVLVAAALIMTTPLTPVSAFEVRPRIVVVLDEHTGRGNLRIRRRRHYRKA